MSVAKVIEVTSGSSKSFKDAMKRGIERAAKTVDNITGAWVSEEKLVIENNEIVEYRVTMRVTFILGGD